MERKREKKWKRKIYRERDWGSKNERKINIERYWERGGSESKGDWN